MKLRKLLGVALCVAAAGWSAVALAEVKYNTLVTELDNPSGVGAHGKTGHVFIVGRAGVYRYDPKSGKVAFEVKGFPTDIYGKGPKYNIGPLGVAFLGDDQLVIGDGSLPDAKEIVRIYRLSSSIPSTPQKADAQEITLGPIGPSKESAKGEGNFYGVAITKDAIFVTSNGDDTKGWILKSELKDGKPGKLTPFIATKPLVNVDAPVAITVSPEGQLAVGQMGEMAAPLKDSLLCFYDPATGKLLKSYKTGLHDISGLAYSPKSGKLYAVDFAWSALKDGGLYRVDINGGEVKTEKIVGLDKPTSLAFDKEGRLYITQFGTQAKGSTKPAGSVVRIDAGL